MNFSDILLIILSSAGLLHGMLFAVYLIFFKKKKKLTNTLLGLILIFMAFRVGKSILLYFGEDLEPTFIILGLALLLLIGPLLCWYFKAMTIPDFKLLRIHTLELIPFFVVFSLSFFIPKNWFSSNNRETVIIFGSILIFIYLHFAIYIFLANRILRRVKKEINKVQSKSQKAIIKWLKTLIISCIVIWVSYFLNIIENTIPYIFGPILYSIVIYFLTYQAFKLNSVDIDGESFKVNDDLLFFNKISKLIIEEKEFLNPSISLVQISKNIGLTPHKTSSVINQYSKKNFNDFINYQRVNEAKEKLISKDSEHYKISAVAFEVGFNSLSSFNSAFKKFVGVTPSVFRQDNKLNG
ncbi:helix-turn-helix domain-containing protein [Tenacibaculum jejuense]|uniref:Transcriptional regulator, AraC family n=1 Tax=Tenacibaculum jejuense TaxID=584609 RepID=A0A238UBM7_9FLAO|nr:helix-turn-helix domain-containing protein [Tenacibaculum jejuense]SNR15820.1 Transcriptional regulator, AraC family [Tenacibaculum jejuense]